MDLHSKEVYLSRRPHNKQEIASLTKIMTGLVCLTLIKKYHVGLKSEILVDEEAAC